MSQAGTRTYTDGGRTLDAGLWAGAGAGAASAEIYTTPSAFTVAWPATEVHQTAPRKELRKTERDEVESGGVRVMRGRGRQMDRQTYVCVCTRVRIRVNIYLSGSVSLG